MASSPSKAGAPPGHLPTDTNGIYVIFASPDVSRQSYDPSYELYEHDWCGYHTLAGPYKYAVVGRDYPGTGCAWGGATPNGDSGLDATVSVLAHEVFETVTDPGGDGYVTNGQETGDLCAWDTGPRGILSGGAQWNLALGNRHYLVQKMIDMMPGTNLGTCEMSHSEGSIGVQTATYGANCATSSDQTAALSAACNGKSSCAYRVDYTQIGDPAPGCAKQYYASWTCNDGPHEATLPAEAGFGSVLNLSCP